MKLWKGYGSEHSMNLVMIGHFQEASDANEAKRLIDQLIEQVVNEEKSGHGNTVPGDRFTDAMLELMKEAKLYILSPAELEQLLYDVRVDVEDNKIVITTDEVDVLALLKVLLDKGARIEVYSAHNYPNTGYGR